MYQNMIRRIGLCKCFVQRLTATYSFLINIVISFSIAKPKGGLKPFLFYIYNKVGFSPPFFFIKAFISLKRMHCIQHQQTDYQHIGAHISLLPERRAKWMPSHWKRLTSQILSQHLVAPNWNYLG